QTAAGTVPDALAPAGRQHPDLHGSAHRRGLPGAGRGSRQPGGERGEWQLMSMIVVYATATGHVLGALAPVGPTGDAPSVSSLVGDALPLWAGLPTGKAMSLTFPAAALASAVVTDQPDVLAVPLAFGVKVGSDNTPAPDLQPLTPS